jgi:hypothetical protein
MRPLAWTARPQTLLFLVVGVLGVLSAGCHGRARVQVHNTHGPDGAADWKRISCTHMDKRCFSAARAMCPNGYYFTRDDSTTSTNKRSASSKTSQPSPRRGVNAKTLPPEEKWGHEMYSSEPGTLVVRCADGTAQS